MKTFIFDNNYSAGSQSQPEVDSWFFLADSSLTNAGKPFFVPDFAEEFEAIPTIAVRINRLGKSISPKFAGRYYSEFAPAIQFRATDLLHKLRDLGLSPDPALSFDRSFIMGDFIPMDTESPIKVVMRRNGEEVRTFAEEKMCRSLNEVIRDASFANTLKIGDLIVPALPEGIKIAIGDTFELSIGNRTLLTVQIK